MSQAKESGDGGGPPTDMGELIDAWSEHYLQVVIQTPELTARDKAKLMHELAKVRARRSKRMPPRSTTPLPAVATFPVTNNPETGAATAAPRKDPSCPPGEASTSEGRDVAPVTAEAPPSEDEPPSRGVKLIREARAARTGRT